MAEKSKVNNSLNSYYLLTLGCAKNLVESEYLAGQLHQAGYQPVSQPADAVWLLVNTCAFITSAVEENIDHILTLAAGKQAGQKLVVIGCLVGRFARKLQKIIPEADLFIAPGQTGNLLNLLQTPPPNCVALAPARDILNGPRIISTGPSWAYLRLSDGCRRRCSFCAIPHIRGKLRSRSQEEVLTEAGDLASAGVREINLVAQDLSSYGWDQGKKNGLLELLEKLNFIAGLRWIRLLYLHPDILNESFLRRAGELDKLLPYFDIPLQHISRPVLAAMGRSGSREELERAFKLLKKIIPQAIIRTTVMVGHPGEEEADFAQLTDFINEFKFNHLGCFIFEPQPGTRSARLPQVAGSVARARYKKVMALQKKISRAHLRALLGTQQDMLFLGAHPESRLLGSGRLWSQAPEADGEALVVEGWAEPGSIVKATVQKAHDYDLEVKIAAQPASDSAYVKS
ncbi:MAG: 30S ribosomal protein S12 methylthiotransferase RimO [Desulfarculales bacterium]|jgi:ribosomal protein S12 methylthiotransferase|nr:30S ribosomal protein S12 methylthiotransferase RimO [Desulfarculales bacterium]